MIRGGKGWIGVDLDGVLAEWGMSLQDHTTGNRDVMQIGRPIPRMVERVKGWLAEGQEVRIVTARVAACGVRSSIAVDDEHFAWNQQVMIEAWCLEQLGQVLPITAKKDWQMIEFYDDRCIQMVTNTGMSLQTALDYAIELLAHYADQLNMYDGASRIVFKSAEEWIARLKELSHVDQA